MWETLEKFLLFILMIVGFVFLNVAVDSTNPCSTFSLSKEVCMTK